MYFWPVEYDSRHYLIGTPGLILITAAHVRHSMPCLLVGHGDFIQLQQSLPPTAVGCFLLRTKNRTENQVSRDLLLLQSFACFNIQMPWNQYSAATSSGGITRMAATVTSGHLARADPSRHVNSNSRLQPKKATDSTAMQDANSNSSSIWTTEL